MLLGRILEPAFGTVGFLRFLAAVNAANGAGVFACCVAGYALTQNANAYLYVRCRGVDGLVAAMLVALSPDPTSANETLQSLRFAEKVKNTELGQAKRTVAKRS